MPNAENKCQKGVSIQRRHSHSLTIPLPLSVAPDSMHNDVDVCLPSVPPRKRLHTPLLDLDLAVVCRPLQIPPGLMAMRVDWLANVRAVFLVRRRSAESRPLLVSE